MGDCCTAIFQAEIVALKEALFAQQKLLQKLYNELEAERESSATAASEALSVILRLQGEKAAIKMEAEQYKRLAEEKMCHAEESFAMIEDIITEKEMEMANLDYQVQTYRYQLMSLGLVDPNEDDIKIPENLLHINECLVGDDTSFHHLGRMDSAPLLMKYKKAMIIRENCAGPEMDFISRNADEINEIVSDSERRADSSVHGGIDSYVEQIRQLELRVKEIAGADYTTSRSGLSSQPSSANLLHETRPPSPLPSFVNPNGADKSIGNESSLTKHSANIPRKGKAVDYPCSSSIHDVFEVPQADPDLRPHESSEDAESKGRTHQDDVKPYAKDEPKRMEKPSSSADKEKNLCEPSDTAAIDHAVVQPTRSVSSSINMSSEINEVERLEESLKREEELKLLKEIKEKLNVLQDEISCQKMKESSMREKPSLRPVSEAMLCFWL